MSHETEHRYDTRKDVGQPTNQEVHDILYPEREGKYKGQPSRAKQMGAAAAIFASIAGGAGYFMGTHQGETPVAPSTEAPVTPGQAETTEPGDVVEPSVEPSADPTNIDNVPTETTEPEAGEATSTPEAPVSLDTPVTVGPFGNEYAPLHSDEILTPTVPMELLRSMDYVEFAMQPVEDRMNYLITRLEEQDRSRNIYFDVDANFVPEFAVGAWSDSNLYAFLEDDPNECAKLSIADNLNNKDPVNNGITDAARQTAEEWKSMCENKTEYSSWGTDFSLSEEPSEVRVEQHVPGFGAPQRVSTLTYNVYNEQTVVAQRTIEAVELTIQRPNGQTVVTYARGFAK